MKIKIVVGKKRVLENEGHDAHVLVRLLAPAARPGAVRPALAVVPVIDVSGSMAGGKLRAVKRALERLIDHLVPGDRVGLVSFSDDARVLLDLAEVSEASRSRLRAAVRALAEQGATNLAAGFLAGRRVLDAAGLPSTLRTRLVLLTDGQANVGPAIARPELRALVRERLAGASLSAFGFGADCEHSILADLAEEGGGSFAYIEHEDRVLTAFAHELGGLVSTYASNVRVRLVPRAGAALEESLGDLLYHGELGYFSCVALPAHERASNIEIARVHVAFDDGSGARREVNAPVLVDYVAPGEEDEVADPEVFRAFEERLLRDAQAAAEAHAQAGEYGAAEKALRQVIARLGSPELKAFAALQLLPSYLNQHAYSAGAGVRASANVALKKRRMVAASPAVADVFAVPLSADEVRMAASFREPPGEG
ncbi:MAG: VWA domain-containing protein [Myxococcota bacterium]|nr:VWA domain-containing protein [Myxococcota bacterium]